MNCQEVQTLLLTDARHLPPDVGAHLLHCADCRARRAAIGRLDADLTRALALPAPEGLHQRLLLAQRLRRRRWHAGFALAASLLAGVALTVQFERDARETPPDWGAAFAEHLLEDPQHTLPADPAAMQALHRALAELGAHEQGELPRVLRADLCMVQNRLAAHLVFEVEGQPVVVFLMPGELPAVQGPAAPPSAADWSGELRTVAGGTVAAFARDPARARILCESLRRSVRWSEI